MSFRITIQAKKPPLHYWKDIWEYRELLVFLSWRDLLVRYKQTVMGVLWGLLRPLITMIIFTVIFGRIAKFPSDNVPYPIFVFIAMITWQFFSTSLSEASSSLISSANMISKIYFPRLIMPLSVLLVNFVDFLIAGVLMVALMIYYHFLPDMHIFVLPIFLLMLFIVSIGCGVWVAALTVKYRDFRYVIPFVVQIGLYITPVGFSSGIVPKAFRLLYYCNPMAGVIDGVRWSVLRGQTSVYWEGVLMSFLVAFVLLWVGVNYFRRTEQAFADII